MAPYTCITVIYCCAAKRATFCFLKWDEDDDDHGLHIEADGTEAYICLSDEQLDQLYHVVKARWAQVYGERS